jgi:hypothetical protein
MTEAAKGKAAKGSGIAGKGKILLVRRHSRAAVCRMSAVTKWGKENEGPSMTEAKSYL